MLFLWLFQVTLPPLLLCNFLCVPFRLILKRTVRASIGVVEYTRTTKTSLTSHIIVTPVLYVTQNHCHNIHSMGRLLPSTRHRIQLAYARCRNISAVARMFKIKYDTAKLWISRTYDLNGVEEKAGRGRKHALDKALSRTAYTLLKSGMYNGAAQVARELHVRRPSIAQKPVAKSTLIKHAKAYGASVGHELVCDRRKPVQKLSEACMHARVQFCRAHTKQDWGNVMFTDRKRFYFLYPGSHVKPAVWTSKGERQVAFRPSAPQCLNLYCGITRYGATACHIVAGTSGMKTKFKTKAGKVAKNICSAEYYHVMKKTLLKDGDRIFKKHGITSWIMQQDNDRSHASASHDALHDYLRRQKDSNIKLLLGWPAHSPDLSPIENFWAVVQMKANSMGCKTFMGFKRTVMQIIRKAPITWFENYYGSMQARMQQCIAKKGARINY